jgi:hypothetical protein
MEKLPNEVKVKQVSAWSLTSLPPLKKTLTRTLPRSNADFIAANFVRRVSDVKEIRDSLGHINMIKNNLGSGFLGSLQKKSS